jgi:hypothetical protein
MGDELNHIPQAEYRALYGLYLECLSARERGERLPKRVSDALPAVRAAYAAQGADERGYKPSATLLERFQTSQF